MNDRITSVNSNEGGGGGGDSMGNMDLFKTSSDQIKLINPSLN